MYELLLSSGFVGGMLRNVMERIGTYSILSYFASLVEGAHQNATEHIRMDNFSRNAREGCVGTYGNVYK